MWSPLLLFVTLLSLSDKHSKHKSSSSHKASSSSGNKEKPSSSEHKKKHSSSKDKHSKSEHKEKHSSTSVSSSSSKHKEKHSSSSHKRKHKEEKSEKPKEKKMKLDIPAPPTEVTYWALVYLLGVLGSEETLIRYLWALSVMVKKPGHGEHWLQKQRNLLFNYYLDNSVINEGEGVQGKIEIWKVGGPKKNWNTRVGVQNPPPYIDWYQIWNTLGRDMKKKLKW